MRKLALLLASILLLSFTPALSDETKPAAKRDFKYLKNDSFLVAIDKSTLDTFIRKNGQAWHVISAHPGVKTPRNVPEIIFPSNHALWTIPSKDISIIAALKGDSLHIDFEFTPGAIKATQGGGQRGVHWVNIMDNVPDNSYDLISCAGI